jgi:hypothetical protein
VTFHRPTIDVPSTGHRLGVTLADPDNPPAPVDHARKLINAAFLGKLEPQDMVHMARALLQISDEMAEVRERMAAMEMAFRALLAGVKS